MSFRQVGIEEGIRLRAAGGVVVDVREPHEWQAGHVPDALHIPLGELPARFGAELPDRSIPILLHCRSGARSERAAQYLVAQGYTDVANLKALIDEWTPKGGAWESAAAPAAAEGRYARQLRLPEVGPDGQRRLAEARVALVGAGGLASSAALYLAAAGVGTLRIIDDDRVALSNLHRQVLHATDRVGVPKVASAAATLTALNPEIRVEAVGERVTPSNADRLLSGQSVVVDGTDRLDARYAINDAAVRARTPTVHGSVYRWEGQVTVLQPGLGPCYRCLHPRQPPAELAPDCDTAGVMGVVPGLVGILQATEALKLILGAGEPLVGRMLAIDALRGRFEELRIERDPTCSACGGLAA